MELPFRMRDGSVFQHPVPEPLPSEFEVEELPHESLLYIFQKPGDPHVFHEPGRRIRFRLEHFGTIPLAYLEVA